MASVCVNKVGMLPENFLDCSPVKYPSYGWLSPRTAFSREFPEEEASKVSTATSSLKNQTVSENANVEKPVKLESDLEYSGIEEFVDFEFQLEDPVKMLPADELFLNGKLVPFQLPAIHGQSMTSTPASSEIALPDTPKFRRRNEISPTDQYLFSPKAPRCSSRWKEILGLKKLYQNSNAKQEDHKTASSLPSHNNNRNAARSLKHFLHRSNKSSLNASDNSSLILPLLKETDNESVSISSRHSLSSSSSGHELDDVPRLSLDSDKPAGTITRNTHQITRNLPRVRVMKHRAISSENPMANRVATRRSSESSFPLSGGVSMDSPRMNSSGKIVLFSLERSSSSPSTFNSGARYKYRGMERSYSANVRVTPVLNVPVCSLRGSSKSGTVLGFPMFSSHVKKEIGSVNGGAGNRNQQINHSKNRIDRT